MIIGALFDSEIVPGGGAAYVYERVSGAWQLSQKLRASNAQSGDLFGTNVAISADTLVIGAGEYGASDPGTAYVFERQGCQWVESAILQPSDAVPGMAFGISVSIDGDWLVVGAFTAPDGGAAYVFTRFGSTWLEVAKLTGSGVVSGDHFGRSSVILGDTVMIGAPQFGNNSGAVFVFDGSVGWAEVARLEASGTVDHKQFGYAVEISGSTAVIGAFSDSTLLPRNGAAYVFEGGGAIDVPFGDGRRCVGSGGVGLFRFLPPMSSGSSGTITLGPGIATRSLGFSAAGRIAAGQTWYFQGWYRDPMGPCGTAFNLSNGVAATFGP
jgi:hypothetical protein